MRSGLILSFLAGALALQLGGCSDGDQAGQQQQQQAPQVGFITVKAQSTTLSRELPGRTTAHQIAEVRPQVSGVIEQRLFEEGQKVEAGQPLYKIDSRTYQAAVDSARAELARAQAREIFDRLVEEDQTYAGSELEDKRVMALIAYMLRLGTDIAKPPPVEENTEATEELAQLSAGE